MKPFISRLITPRYLLVLVVGVSLVGSFLYLPTEARVVGSKEQTYIPNQLIVKLRPDAAADQSFLARYNLNSAEKILGQHVLRGSVKQAAKTIGIDRLYLAETRGANDLSAVLKALSKDPRVEYAEPNYILRVALVSNDPGFPQLWGLNNTGQTGGTVDADIDAPEAWDIIRNSTHVVGVIDTGIDYTHEDLAANMWTNPEEIPGNGIDDDGNGFIDDVYGWDFINNDNDPFDDHGHGTHVAGTIAAVGDNGVGVVGVNWQVKVAAIKFLSAGGSGTTADAVKAIQYANQMGFAITNNSWGGGGFSQALYDAIAAANAAGHLFVAAAGNSGVNADVSPMYPAAYDLPNIISVAATDHNDLKASFSNYGVASVDLGAPGVNIYSTVPTGSCSLCDPSGYKLLSGTSMASPHVAGALALLKAQFSELSHRDLIYQMLGNVDEISGFDNLVFSGGRLNIYKALTLAPKPIASFVASPQGGSPPLTVTFTDNSLGNITSHTLDYGDGSPPITYTSNGSTTHTYNNVGNYIVILTVSGPNGTSTRSRQIVVVNNYTFAADTFDWIDTSGMNELTLIDDSVSQALSLPFLFTFYDQSYTTVYVGSNGLLTVGSNAGATKYINTDIPNVDTPNNGIYPYWDDLNPGVAGQVRYGTAPDGSFVVSWEGVPHFSNSTATFTFQVVLFPSGDIKMQYLDVKSLNTSVGAGRSATIGVEYFTGLTASKYSYNGSTLLSNNQAIRFTTVSNSKPVADVGGPYNGIEEEPIIFDGSASYDPDGDSLVYRWDFGDGIMTSSTEPTVSHIYTRGGTYTTTLIVNDGFIDSDPSTTIVEVAEVNGSPIANAGPDRTITVGESVIFDGSASSDEEGPIETYFWNFGDGNTASGIVVSHAYSTGGTFIVTLTVTDSGGLTAEDTATVTVITVDTVTITKANYHSIKKQLTIEANSSRGGEAVLTVVNFGIMNYVANKNLYYLTVKNVTQNPGTVTVFSSLGGTDTKAVKQQVK